ncbi:hydrolase, partial [Burkholderia pseudomallei]
TPQRNGPDTETPVTRHHKFTTSRESLETWPASNVQADTLYVGPRGALRWGLSCLCPTGVSGPVQAAPHGAAGAELV